MIDRRGLIGGGVALAATAGLGGPARAAGEPLVNRIRLGEGRVFIAAKIRDKGPYLFVIDTGGFASLINEQFANSFGMKPVSNRETGPGIGGTSKYSWYDAGTVTLESGVYFPHMLFVGTHALGGGKAIGSFGVGMFTSYDSDLDFVKNEWRVYRDGRPDFAGLTELPVRFMDQGVGGYALLARATIDGAAGDFILDTGAPSTLSIGGKMATRSGLWDDGKPYAPTISRGIGPKTLPGRLVRANRLSVGSFDFDRPIVKVSDPRAEWIERDGLIGLHTLACLNLTTDVSHRKLWATRNGLPEREPGYSGSGLWIDHDSDKVVVGDVGTGSPAAAAGIKRGDRLQGGFDALLARIGAPFGTEVPLTVESGGSKRDVTLKLAAYL